MRASVRAVDPPRSEGSRLAPPQRHGAFRLLLVLVLAVWNSGFAAAAPVEVDVVVYGANAAGVLSAVAAARRGSKTALLCSAWPDCWAPSRRIGGLTTGGLGTTDSCRQSAHEPDDLCQLAITGGLTKEFYARSASRYGCFNCTAEEGCHGCNRTLADRQMPYNVEPSVALEVLENMVKAEAANLALYFEAQVELVAKRGAHITSITTDDGRQFSGRVFVDSSYEGDLYARAGVEYTVGREAPSKYNETLAGRLKGDPKNDNNFQHLVDPMLNATTTLPGLMTPEDAAETAGKPGEGDSKVQAYNFRLCVTNNPSNLLPFYRPDEYHPEDWELLARTFRLQPDGPAGVAPVASSTGSGGPGGHNGTPSCNTQPIPNFKFDHNNCGLLHRVRVPMRGPVMVTPSTSHHACACFVHLSQGRSPPT